MSEEQAREPRASATTAEETMGNTSVAEMTALQLKTLIQSALKEALQEVLGDPDAGLELRPEFEERLRQTVSYVTSGGRLLSMEELTSQFDVGRDVSAEGGRLPGGIRDRPGAQADHRLRGGPPAGDLQIALSPLKMNERASAQSGYLSPRP